MNKTTRKRTSTKSHVDNPWDQEPRTVVSHQGIDSVLVGVAFVVGNVCIMRTGLPQFNRPNVEQEEVASPETDELEVMPSES